jgi:hypothetical protein
MSAGKVWPRALIAFALTLAGAALRAETTYYASNLSGMAFEEIPEFRRSEFDYYLEIARAKGGEERTLKTGAGVERKRWRYAFGDSGRLALTEYFERGALVYVERYDGNGILVAEERYSGGLAYERTDYRYKDGILDKAITSGVNGIVLSTDSYRYALNGALREVEHVSADGSVVAAGVDSLSGSILRSWQKTKAGTEMATFEPSGQVASLETWKDGAPVKTEDRTRVAGIRKDYVEDIARGTRIEREYGPGERLLKESAYKGARWISTTEYRYREDGKLEEKLLASGAREILVRFAYTDSGELRTEEYSEGGVIQKKIVYLAADSISTELYYQGELSVRTLTLGGRKKNEEIIEGGKVVRSREFP